MLMFVSKTFPLCLQVAGNFHFAPGKSFQQSHVHGKTSEKRQHEGAPTPQVLLSDVYSQILIEFQLS